jgi:hypothetical protein
LRLPQWICSSRNRLLDFRFICANLNQPARSVHDPRRIVGIGPITNAPPSLRGHGVFRDTQPAVPAPADRRAVTATIPRFVVNPPQLFRIGLQQVGDELQLDYDRTNHDRIARHPKNSSKINAWCLR